MNRKIKLAVIEKKITDYKIHLEHYNNKIHSKKVIGELDRLLEILKQECDT